MAQKFFTSIKKWVRVDKIFIKRYERGRFRVMPRKDWIFFRSYFFTMAQGFLWVT